MATPPPYHETEHISSPQISIPFTPRPPPGPHAAHPSGGFFRSLNYYREQNAFDIFDGSSMQGALQESPRSTSSKLRECCGEVSRSPESLFVEKLSLKFLEGLWTAIKQNSIDRNRGGSDDKRDDKQTIDLHDLLRIWRQQTSDHANDDKRRKQDDRNDDNFAAPVSQDEHYLELLFNRVDRRRRRSVRTTDIATAMVLISSTESIPKLRTLFRIFDADEDNCLTHNDVFDMYLSIKVNDITRSRQALTADVLFEEELSLQEAKRLYVLTIEHLNIVSDFVIFEEFSRVFDERPWLLENLLPGAFSLEWILKDYQIPSLEHNQFGTDVKKGLIDALRRGEEDLDLSKKKNRGTRIMQSCLNFAGKPAANASEDDSSQGPPGSGEPARVNLPRLKLANKSKTPRSGFSGRLPTSSTATPRDAPNVSTSNGDGRSRQVEADDEEGDVEDDSDSDDDLDGGAYGYGSVGADKKIDQARGPAVPTPRRSSGAGPEKSSYSMQEALELQTIEVLSTNHKNAKIFRSMMLDAKTQAVYMRKKDVNRTVKYQCLVCAVNHEFRLNKPMTGAEHQHLHCHQHAH